MPISLLPSLLFALFAVGYSPGPANLYSLACCLKFGRRKALKMWRGLLTGFSIGAVIMVVLLLLLLFYSKMGNRRRKIIFIF